MTTETINFLARWGHLLFGITWIGMLYYFNFVQGGYFKQATAEGLADAKQKLAPSALWWFRWGAMFTFLTGLILLGGVQHYGQYCASDEIFLPENQIKKTENNKTGTVTARSIESGKKLRWVWSRAMRQRQVRRRCWRRAPIPYFRHLWCSPC